MLHGTATSLLPVVVLIEEDVPGTVEELELELDVELESVVLDPIFELSCSTANSTRPEVGLMIRSLIVPMLVPELPCTWEPSSLLARTACPDECELCMLE